MLNANIMAQDLFNELEAADRQLAARLGLNFERDVNTPQKQSERLTIAQAFANMMFKTLTQYAVVVVPAHQSNAAVTGIGAGPGSHTHSTNQPPIAHKNGKLI